MCLYLLPSRWAGAKVSISGKEFLPTYRLNPNAAFLDLMTNYSEEEKSTYLYQTGFRADTATKAAFNK